MVHNVVGRLAGHATPRAPCCWWPTTTPCPRRPGAADDGSGVAALLETARALRSGPPPRNDVIFLFTDGEEQRPAGRAGVPARRPLGLRRRRRPSTSTAPARRRRRSCTRRAPATACWSREYLAATDPFSSSLMYEVSRRQPIVERLPALRRPRHPGDDASACWTGRPTTTRPTTRSPRSTRRALQHEGETALPWPAASATPTCGTSAARRRLLRRHRGRRRRLRAVAGSAPFAALAVAAVRGGGRGDRRRPPPAHAARRRLGRARHGRHAGRLAARGRRRLDDVPHGLRGARLDAAPASSSATGTGSASCCWRRPSCWASTLACCAVCAPGTSPSSALAWWARRGRRREPARSPARASCSPGRSWAARWA